MGIMCWGMLLLEDITEAEIIFKNIINTLSMTGSFLIIQEIHLDYRGKIMTKKSNSSLALNAMRRVSKQAIKKAADLNLKIPVWKNGKILLVEAKEKNELTRA